MRTFGGAEDRREVRFLELGCGFGAQLRFLWAEGFYAEGMDGSQTAVDYVQAMPERRGLVVHADLADFPEADDGFRYDCIVDVCTLQHISPDVKTQLIYKARGWLKPGGWIFSKHRAYVPDAYHWPADSSVPEPSGLFERDIPKTFAGFDLQVSKEAISSGGHQLHHWIITGRKT